MPQWSNALARDRARAWVELRDLRQSLPGGLGVAFVGRGLQASALLQCPLQPPRALQPLLDLVGEPKQMDHVLGGVAELLRSQRPHVPARIGRGLAHAQAEHRPEQVAVARLGAGSGEAGRDLGVEDVVDLGLPRPAQDRDVLATGVQHDLELGVAEQLRQRRDVDVGQRVDQQDDRVTRLLRGVDRDLDEAQQGAVAPFGHELRVDPEPAGRARDLGGAGDLLGGRKIPRVHTGTLPCVRARQPRHAGRRR